MLVPDTNRPWSLPVLVDNLEDEPLIRKRMERISSRHAQAIVDSVQELRDLGLVKVALAEVRINGEPPRFKLYVLNGEEAFFGFYPVFKHNVTLGGEPQAIYDMGGKDAELFHFAVSDGGDSTSGQFVNQSRMWFDNMWTTVAREIP